VQFVTWSCGGVNVWLWSQRRAMMAMGVNAGVTVVIEVTERCQKSKVRAGRHGALLKMKSTCSSRCISYGVYSAYFPATGRIIYSQFVEQSELQKQGT
jgi:hypothetical protein